MLILSRFPNERIMIDTGTEEIVVTVLERRGDKVRLGITAPRYVRVNREEVLEREKNNARPHD